MEAGGHDLAPAPPQRRYSGTIGSKARVQEGSHDPHSPRRHLSPYKSLHGCGEITPNLDCDRGDRCSPIPPSILGSRTPPENVKKQYDMLRPDTETMDAQLPSAFATFARKNAKLTRNLNVKTKARLVPKYLQGTTSRDPNVTLSLNKSPTILQLSRDNTGAATLAWLLRLSLNAGDTVPLTPRNEAQDDLPLHRSPLLRNSSPGSPKPNSERPPRPTEVKQTRKLSRTSQRWTCESKPAWLLRLKLKYGNAVPLTSIKEAQDDPPQHKSPL
jgi:hypothetical protein